MAWRTWPNGWTNWGERALWPARRARGVGWNFPWRSNCRASDRLSGYGNRNRSRRLPRNTKVSPPTAASLINDFATHQRDTTTARNGADGKYVFEGAASSRP